MDMRILEKYGEWIWRAIILLAVSANLWLTTNFVTRDEYERAHKELKDEMTNFQVKNVSEHMLIQTAISDISTTLKIMSANTVKLDDHEARIRIHSDKLSAIESRLCVVENTVKK